jgi:gliding motility-associated-like protein
MVIDVDENALVPPTPDLFRICDGDQVTLNAQQSFDATYLWSTGGSTASLVVSSIGTYEVTVTSNCDELTHEVIVEEGDCRNPTVFIPNVFSPNDDGANDIFSIDLDDSDITEFHVQIFDRWGELLYFSADPRFEWRGDFNGEPLQPGVYVYYFKLKREGSRAEIYKGDITLVR